MTDSMDVDMVSPNRDGSTTDSPKGASNTTVATTSTFEKPKLDHLEAFGADLDDDHHSTNSSSKDIDVFKRAESPAFAPSNKKMADTVADHHVDAGAQFIPDGAKADAELDKEEAVSMLVDTPLPPSSSTNTASAAIPKHVALRDSELSPVSGSSSPEIPLNPLMSRVSFPGERAFSTDNTDSDGSDESEEDNVETLDSDAFSSLDVSARNTPDNVSFTEQEDEGQVTANLTRALQTQAVELCVEVRGLAAAMMRAPRALFVVLYVRGSSPGTWSELERTEGVIDPRGNNRWVHKMRLPAATTLDRSEYISLAVFEEKAKSGSSSTGVSYKKQTEEGPENALAACSLRVAQLLCSPSMALDIELTSPRSNRVKGVMSLAADLVPHLEHDELLTFDVAFEKDAPARNRVLYVLSRSVPKGRWSPIYRSEVRTRGELDMFRSAVLKNREVNSGNEKRLLRIEFYRFYKNRTCTLLGFCQTSLLQLRTCPLYAGIYWWPAQDGIPNAKVVVTRRTVTEESSSFSLRVVPESRKFTD